jgi:CheY-like chemotaxis protein
MPAIAKAVGVIRKGYGGQGSQSPIAEVPRFERDERREQVSRLESVGQLAGGVAHDFNNLLGVILNYSDFVAQELDPGTSAHRDVVEIRRAAERATELCRQLLIFSRREEIDPKPLDLNEVVRETERLLDRTLGEHVELSVELAPGLPNVLGDPGQIEQVLVNLAVNARDAMPEGGRLRIETAAFDDQVRLSVADSGCGMPPEVVVRVFEPFYSTKRKGEGTGLGLATVYGIVAAAGGRIAIESEPGAGTTFIVDLPASTDTAVESDGDSTESVMPGRGEHVLVVEDEDSVRTLATRILAEGGYRVTAVSRGREALKLLAMGDPEFDLVLSDMVMPEMRGIELSRRAAESHPDLPVLLMSGYTTPMSEAEQRELRHTTVLEKPFSASALLKEVRGRLDERMG